MAGSQAPVLELERKGTPVHLVGGVQQFALGANPLHPFLELPDVGGFRERPHGDGVLPLLQVSLPNVGANSFQPRIIGC